MAFEFSYWLFNTDVTTLQQARATLKAVNSYIRLLPALPQGSPHANTQMELYVKDRQFALPEWFDLVGNYFDVNALNQGLLASGYNGIISVTPNLAGLAMVLLIEVNQRVFAVSAGSSIGLLDRDTIVHYAGKDAYLNEADDGDLSEVSSGSGGRQGKTVTVRSNRPARTDQFPKGDGLRLVKHVEGLTTLAGAKVEASGSHQYRTQGSVNLTDIVNTCVGILTALSKRTNRKPEFSILAPTEPVSDLASIASLDNSLHAALMGSSLLDISFLPPSVDFSGPYTYTLLYQAGPRQRSMPPYSITDWSELNMRTIIRQALNTSWHLRRAEICISAESKSKVVPFIRCISYVQHSAGQTKMILDDGTWNEVQLTFIQELDRDINIMWSRWQPTTLLPNRSTVNHPEEKDYNDKIAAQLGYVCLDKAKARPQFYGSPLELCDMFSPDGCMYLVKAGTTALPVVYVTDQGIAAVSALMMAPQYWEHYTQTQGVTFQHDPRLEPFRFRCVIALISDKPTPLPTQLRYKAKRALTAFDSRLRSEWKIETGLCHILEVP